MSDKFKRNAKLPGVESRYLTPRTSSDDAVRSAEGLALPSERLFVVLVGIYKIYQTVAAVVIILATILFLLISYLMITDEREEANKVSAYGVPLLILASAFLIANNVVGWIAILTYRMRYLWANLWLHCVALAATLAYMFLMMSLDYLSVVILVVNIGLVAIVYVLIHEIHVANPGQI